jgi:hypothetical protein
MRDSSTLAASSVASIRGVSLWLAPLSGENRLEQTVQLARIDVNSIPSDAKRSMFGVRTSDS